jgi:hypothetical protein
MTILVRQRVRATTTVLVRPVVGLLTEGSIIARGRESFLGCSEQGSSAEETHAEMQGVKSATQMFDRW